MDKRICPYQGAPPYEMYDLQTRLDCDDMIGRDYVKRLRLEVSRSPKSPMVVSFQPHRRELWTGSRYRMALRYHRRRCSMFLSLWQPDIANRRYIYEFKHGQIWRAFPRVVTVPEGYCDMVIHGRNRNNSILKADKRIP